MKPYLIIDIETGPLPEDHQRQIAPTFEAPTNYVDEKKIKAAIADKEASWLESATLDATRCEVLAIGLKSATKEDLIHPANLVHDGTERGMLQLLANHIAMLDMDKIILVGHRLLAFDIPILVRRMWANGIKPPQKWLNCTAYKAHRDWAFDTAVEWGLGNRDQYIKLDHLAFHLGVGRKNGDGAMFWKTYAEDQKKALDYLSNDLRLTEGCYLKMI